MRYDDTPLHFVPPYGINIRQRQDVEAVIDYASDVKEHLAPLQISTDARDAFDFRALQMHECIRMLAAEPADVAMLCLGI